MFDVHKVKPIHGWREFLGEVGIIVLGVLIALTAESLLERWHWHEQTEETRNAIKTEVEQSALFAWERLAVENCLRTQLQLLLNKVTADTAVTTASPVSLWHRSPGSPIVPPAYSVPSRIYVSDAWKNALSNGVYNSDRRSR